MEVEIRETSPLGNKKPDINLLPLNNTSVYLSGESTEVVIRVEEVLLVCLVLLIWVAAIALFINRWGKIRMLEPYQPKFHQQPHRPSCPLAPLSPPLPPSNTITRAKLQNPRMSFSKYNVNAMTDPLSLLPSPIIRKPRRSSVFVGSSAAFAVSHPPPRRTKSAMDIHHLVVNERSPTYSLSGNRKGSVIPILNKDRRSSTTGFERSPHLSRQRASISIERPIVALQQCKSRRSSCFVERPVFSYIGGRQKQFMSFENSSHFDQKTMMNFERPSCSYHHHFTSPIVSSRESSSSSSKPLVLIESAYLRETVPILTLPKLSRSFEQPSKQHPKPERMANSLEITAVNFEKTSIKEEDRSSSSEKSPSPERSTSPVSIYIDDTKVTAPLLEGLKSTDV